MYSIKNKWSTVKKPVINGEKYDSNFEAKCGMELEAQKKAGEIKDYRRQEKIELIVNGYHIANYYIDFTIYHNDGTIEYRESKGLHTEVWRLKWKIFEALYSEKPGVILTIIQQKSLWGRQQPKRPKIRKIKTLNNII